MNNKCFAAACAAIMLAGCAANPVTGKREIRLFSDKSEVSLGAKTRDSVIKEYGRYNDAALEAYVAGVGRKLAGVCDRRELAYEFYVLDTDMVNAFAAPGGYIFVTKGILKAMEDEAELAAVVGHEIGHVTARHGMKALEKQYGYQAILNIATAVSGRDLSGIQQYSDYLAGALLAGYGRENEFQADDLGARYAMGAGYDPRGAVDFFGKLEKMEGGKKANDIQKLFMSHPPTRDRIKKLEAGIAASGGRAGERNRAGYAAAVKGIK